MDLAIGIDVGFSLSRKTTGVVILNRKTGMLPQETQLVVETAEKSVAYVNSEIRRLKPKSAVFCLDGPFASGDNGGDSRHVERYFTCGPFASSGAASLHMRIGPAPTAGDNHFLQVTAEIINALSIEDPQHRQKMNIVNAAHGQPVLNGNIIEIFPTLFMAALFPPHPYVGTRNAHTDILWHELGGHQHLIPYNELRAAVEEEEGVSRRHDLRAAATSAIAADWYAGGHIDFIGHPGELGFVLPGEDKMNAAFRAMLVAHWEARGGPPLLWL